MIDINHKEKISKPTVKKSGHKLHVLPLILMVMAAFILVIVLRSTIAGGGDIVIQKKTTPHAQCIIKEIQGVPSIAQLPELPSGCEIAALTMLLNWAGASVDKAEVARAIPKGPVPAYRDGVMRGGNPNSVFIGDPFTSGGLGVYNQPIALLINKYLPGQAINVTGTDFKNVLKMVDNGQPVILWATIDMAEPKLYTSWYDEKGNKIDWMIPEHAFLLIGYSDTEVIVNDPYIGKRLYYPIDTFQARWEAMGRQAVSISNKIAGNVITTILDK